MLNDVYCFINKVFRKFSSNMYILFHGGEPLLRFNEIRQIVEKIENSCFSKYVKYLIQTNGIYINSEVIEFFKKYGFGVGVSIDGFTDVSNINRLDFNGKSTTKNYCFLNYDE